MNNFFKYLSFLITSSLIFLGTTIGSNKSSNSPEGYLINPIVTPYGIVVSNEFENVLYLITEESIKPLVEAPGCGRYIKFSKDYSNIGLKIINPENGMQRPAVFDLKEMRLNFLSDWVKKSGQVSFTQNGKTAFMIDEWLYVKDDVSVNKYDLKVFSNNTAISPDGFNVVYKDDADQLWIYNLPSSSRQKITDSENGYYNAQWSPKGNDILFESVNAKIYFFNNETGIKFIAEGENPKWSPDSKSILYNRKEIDFANVRLINSDLYIYNLSANEENRITSTADQFEMNASFNSVGNEIVFDTYSGREIKKIYLTKHNTESAELIYKLKERLQINSNKTFNKAAENINIPADLDEWVHIHQVLDTRDSGSWTSDPKNGRHQGYLCCGAASAMEVIASYGILPPSPITTRGHISNYGKYISDAYTYNGFTYSGFTTTSTNPGFPTGAHGFMWNYGSPHSNAVSFLTNHGIEAVLSDDMNWSKVKAELDTGFPYILCSTGLTDGHIVVAIGQNQNYHSLYCNDPYGDKNAGSYGSILNGRNAIYDWADENTGHVKITPVVWGITARYSKTLQLLSSYPANSQTGISPSSHIFVNFYGQVNPETVKNNINLMSENGNILDYSFESDKCSEGVVELIPFYELDENSNYTVYINNKIENSKGQQFKRNEQIQFRTGSERKYIGDLLDGFESKQNWSLNTSGISGDETNTTITSDQIKDEQFSLRLNYKFSGTSNGFVRFLYSPELKVDPAKTLGIWLFGDCSNNSIELWFTSAGSLVRGLSKVVDWSGWKFIELPLNQLNLASGATFNCFALRQSSNAQKSGTIYFDGLMLTEAYAQIITCFPSIDEKNVSLNSDIVIGFSCPMDSISLKNAFKILPEVSGTLKWINGDNKLIFAPAELYEGNTIYSVYIDSSAKALDGPDLSYTHFYSFTTKRNKLSLVANYPYMNENNVSTIFDVILQFDNPINPLSLSGNIMFVDSYNNNISIAVESALYSKGIVKFKARTELLPEANYKIILKPEIKDTEGLLFSDNMEINFRTAAAADFNGTVFYDFENDTDWINPKENGKSVGVDYINTNYYRDNKYSKNGLNSGALRYKFKGVNGVCVLEPNYDMIIENKNNFAIWVYGDFSNNVLEYTFSDVNNNFYQILADTIKWTGWQLVSVALDSLRNVAGLKFNSLSVVQSNNGAYEGLIYLDDIQTDIILSSEEANTMPLEFALKQNYPNPFNPVTTIQYSFPANVGTLSGASVRLAVYDVLGREVTVLVNEFQKPGSYKIDFDASGISSGVYIYRLKINSFVSAKKLVLLK